MRFSTPFSLATILLAPLVVSASPVKRAADPDTVKVARFASVFDAFEAEYYKQAVAKFKPADFNRAGSATGHGAIHQITNLHANEINHNTTLHTVLKGLGAAPIEGCKFVTSSILSDTRSLGVSARVIEQLGVSGYLGTAHLIQDPNVRTAVASIMTTQRTKATTTTFNLPMSVAEVVSIGRIFVTGCDLGSELGVTPNPALFIDNNVSITSGASLTFNSSALKGSTSDLKCQMLAPGQANATVLPFNECVVPKGVEGTLAVWITDHDTVKR